MSESFNPSMIGAPVEVRTANDKSSVGILEAYGAFRSGTENIERTWWRFRGDREESSTKTSALVVKEVAQSTTDYAAAKAEEILQHLDAVLWQAARQFGGAR